MLLAFASACGLDPIASCADGFERRDDGNCYEVAVADEPEDEGAGVRTRPGATDWNLPEQQDGGVEEATLADVLDAIAACYPATGAGTIDVDEGCADGACAGMEYDAITDALGSAAVCTGYSSTRGTRTSSGTTCEWEEGLTAGFRDSDEDWDPDDGAGAYSIQVALDWKGATELGLGIDAGLRCAMDELGDPSLVQFTSSGDGWAPALLGWSHPKLYAYDEKDNSDGGSGADGLIDKLLLYGG